MRNNVLTTVALLCAVVAFAVGTTRREARATEPNCELIVFTYRAPGVCPACDRARPTVQRMAKEFPIRFEYFGEPNGDAARAIWRVDRAPTFILTTILGYGKPRELLRWSGADDVERRIRSAFAKLGIRPGAPPRPRPIPPQPRPEPRPKPRPTPAPTPRPKPFPSPRPFLGPRGANG